MEKFELIVRQFFYLSICNSSHKVNISLVLFIYLFFFGVWFGMSE